jgi:hypothetical protein
MLWLPETEEPVEARPGQILIVEVVHLEELVEESGDARVRLGNDDCACLIKSCLAARERNSVYSGVSYWLHRVEIDARNRQVLCDLEGVALEPRHDSGAKLSVVESSELGPNLERVAILLDGVRPRLPTRWNIFRVLLERERR